MGGGGGAGQVELRPVLVDVTTEEMAVGMMPHRFTLLDTTRACRPVRALYVAGMVEK